MALTVGSLNVILNASTGPLFKGLAAAEKAVEKFVRSAKKATADLSNVGLRAAAALAAAAIAASKFDPRVAAQLEKMKSLLNGIAAQVAQAALPAIQAFSDVLSKVLGWLQGMDPHMRATIAHAIKLGLEFTLAAVAVNKLLTAVDGMLGLIRIFSKLGLALAPIVIALGLIWVASAFLRNALGTDFTQIGEWASDLWTRISTGAQKMFSGFGKAIDAFVGWFANAFNFIKKIFVDWATNWLKSVAAIAKMFGVDLSGVTDFMEDLVKWADYLTTENGLVDFWNDGVAAAKKGAATMKGDVKSLSDFMKKLLPKMDKDGKGLDGNKNWVWGEASQHPGGGSSNNEANLIGLGGDDSVMRAVGDVKLKADKFVDDFFDQLNRLPSKLANGVNKIFATDFGLHIEEALKRGEFTVAESIKKQFDIAVEFAGVVGDNMGKAALAIQASFNKIDFARQVEAALKTATEAAEHGFKEKAAAFEGLAKELTERLRVASNAVAGLTSQFVSKLGKTGELLNTAVQGFQAGGPWGALIAVIADLFLSSKQVQQALALLDQGFQMISDLIGTLAEPLVTIFGAINDLLSVVFQAIGPALKEMTKGLDGIAAVIEVFAKSFGPILSAFIEMSNIFQDFTGILDPIKPILSLAFRAFFEIFKWLGVGLLYVVKGIQTVFNAILGAIAGVFRAISDFSILGAKPFAGLKNWADSLDGARVDVDKTQAAINTLKDATFDAAMAQAENTAKVGEATAAAAKFAEQLTNVPTGARVAANRYGATDVGGLGGGGAFAGVQSSIDQVLSFTAPEHSATPVVNVYVSGSVVGADDLAELIRAASKRASRQRSGSSAGGL